MNITIICSNFDHPVKMYLDRWISEISNEHDVNLVSSTKDLTHGDFLFLVSCSEIVPISYLSKYRHSLILHASDLPNGRGWSPHIWDLVNGKTSITLCLLEAEDKVDSGKIWFKRKIQIAKTMLWYEINDALFRAEIGLMQEALKQHAQVRPFIQENADSLTYYRKRTPLDSKIDPSKSIMDQFNLMRLCDPGRYPAWFELDGHKYKISIEKHDDE
ncbi:formyltransferase family protein [Salinibius halmophilus]|uniref:formyltransferase family protein n=1 Tax=Salinibius halmophilus TaxID=1853216 RepID=UPI0018F77EBD|nr:formyltransferase family protein [Salinibius halmophilus]